jgi:5-methylcytosine-specific restriction protein A
VGGCDAPASWCDVHHVLRWEDGGQASVDNGVLACRHHHHLVHKPGYQLELLADGTTELTRPDGTVETNRPRGPSPRTLLDVGGPPAGGS